MSWQEYAPKPRPLRSQRAPSRRARGTQREWRPLEMDPVVVEGAVQLRRYEAYVSQLVAMHMECGERFDWRRVMTTPPRPPAHSRQCELATRLALEAFRPGIADRLTGRATRLRAKLEAKVDRAIEQDRIAYEEAVAYYQAAYTRWERASTLAAGVLAGDVRACREALALLEAYVDVTGLGTEVELEGPGVVACVIRDSELVPREELTLSATGTLSSSPMVPRKYWALFRDHVQSCAIRVARETFAALPIDSVVVNVMIERSGVRDPVLAVQFARHQLERLIVRGMDPRDAIRAFPHRLQFHPSVGFDRIETMTAVSAAGAAAPST
jgi:hypothetical protein